MQSANLKTVVSIAGTDPSGGAGIQADIKAISATGSYAASIITALVAQNTQGVQAIYPISAEFVEQQLDSVFSDMHVDAVKIGMLHDKPIIDVVARALNRYKPKYVVLDPVMVAKNGCLLIKPEIIDDLKKTLLPRCTIITPNIPEAECLLNQRIQSQEEMHQAAIALSEQFQTHVLLKGGHSTTSAQASDILYDAQHATHQWFHEERILTKNTHGTGCTLSSAIASYLAQQYALPDAIFHAKKYLTQAIQSGSRFTLGKGHGPVDHFYFLKSHQEAYI